MRFRILGHLEVQGPDGWTAISAAKWRSLLARAINEVFNDGSVTSLFDGQS